MPKLLQRCKSIELEESCINRTIKHTYTFTYSSQI